MILRAIIALVSVVIVSILQFLPFADPAVISQIDSGLTPFKNYLAGADWFFPMATFFTVVSMVFVIESVILLFKLIHWLAKTLSAGFVH